MKDGELLAGTDSWVKQRLARGWQPARRDKGSEAARAAALVDARPFLLLVSRPSEVASRRMAAAIGGENDFVTGHRFAALALHANGMAWSWVDRSRAGFDRAVMFSEGLLEVLRALVVAPRGAARMIAASLDSYSGKDAAIDFLVQNKSQLLAAIEGMTGDGKFAVKWDKEAAKYGFTVRATGKKLSDVLPLAAVGPFLAAALFAAQPVVEPVQPMQVPARVEGKETSGPTGAKPGARKPAPRPAPPSR